MAPRTRTHFVRRRGEGFGDAGVQVSNVGEVLYLPGGAPVGQLAVEDQLVAGGDDGVGRGRGARGGLWLRRGGESGDGGGLRLGEIGAPGAIPSLVASEERHGCGVGGASKRDPEKAFSKRLHESVRDLYWGLLALSVQSHPNARSPPNGSCGESWLAAPSVQLPTGELFR